MEPNRTTVQIPSSLFSDSLVGLGFPPVTRATRVQIPVGEDTIFFFFGWLPLVSFFFPLFCLFSHSNHHCLSSSLHCHLLALSLSLLLLFSLSILLLSLFFLIQLYPLSSSLQGVCTLLSFPSSSGLLARNECSTLSCPSIWHHTASQTGLSSTMWQESGRTRAVWIYRSYRACRAIG